MNIKHYLLALMVVFSAFATAQQTQYKVHTVAFYNVENLFDFEDDPITYDDDRTPEGRDHWTEEIYEQKLTNMAKVITEIGADVAQNAPVIIGLSEIENRRVLDDLANEPAMLPLDYGIVQYDSPDRRGIDVALMYQKNHFRVKSSSAHELLIYDDSDGDRVYTRDQLLVTGMLDGEEIHIIVNHWPSRSGGEERSRKKRLAAAELNKKIIDSIYLTNANAKIITMGDLNDDPTNESVKDRLGAVRDIEDVKAYGLYNPMENMMRDGLGTLAYRDGWNLFDQIIMSEPLTRLLNREDNSEGWQYYKAGIFNRNYLSNPRGRYKGYPFRSFSNGSFTGGYSDHFPVYVYLIKPMITE